VEDLETLNCAGVIDLITTFISESNNNKCKYLWRIDINAEGVKYRQRFSEQLDVSRYENYVYTIVVSYRYLCVLYIKDDTVHFFNPHKEFDPSEREQMNNVFQNIAEQWALMGRSLKLSKDLNHYNTYNMYCLYFIIAMNMYTNRSDVDRKFNSNPKAKVEDVFITLALGLSQCIVNTNTKQAGSLTRTFFGKNSTEKMTFSDHNIMELSKLFRNCKPTVIQRSIPPHQHQPQPQVQPQTQPQPRDPYGLPEQFQQCKDATEPLFFM
jgi:hypothetical protein